MNNYTTITSDKSKKTATMLCALGFLGFGGIHDFYLGKIGIGAIKFFTCNFFFLGTVYDIIKLATGGYRDNADAPLRK